MLNRKLTRRSTNRYDNTAYLYLLPAFLLLGIFTIYPIINTFITSFKDNFQFLTGNFAGINLSNYIKIIGDSTFRRALLNTFFIAFVCVPATILISLILALCLNSVKRLQGLYLTLFYLPQVTNVIASGLVFSFIFNTHFGLINMVLGWFGIHPVAWISGEGIVGSPERYNQAYARSLFILFVYSVWEGLSLHVLLFMRGLQNINKEYYEAAQVDGASRWRMIRSITLPLLSPTTSFLFVTSIIFAFRAYASVVALFGKTYGPPGDDSKMMITLVGYIMDSLGDYLSPGAISSAGAAAVVLVLMVMVVVFVQLFLMKRWVHYQ
ncbi:sugar ABC transporter permease [Paenibacillus filicis]|uniref:Sugar ABC transporter permease n=1 Tax=Paenibacillus gyeongsangnamensis TaxID=3388067 RepID=A0ABT4Q3X7_9BACL|nr:sugar ABC transporter permease [Paenibacillus filicis]MCZ8511583.1 sugar ABC transporter permease [Paenibacillus filicis]